MPSPRSPRPSLPSVPLPAPRLVVFLSSPSIQFDHGRFSEMRSQMGNASWPKGSSDSVSQSVGVHERPRRPAASTGSVGK